MKCASPIVRRLRWIAPTFFAALTLAIFAPQLFGPRSGSHVISGDGADMRLQFIAWRDFGFSQLRAGHLPLWNPHIYGGAPYVAGFQSALLYPPNWVHLLLPLARAINWIIALHVFAAGYFTHLWIARRTHTLAAPLLAGTMFMFGGPYFLHIYAGHLPHVSVIVWMPLIFLAIDGLMESAHPKWWLLGSVAVAMQIFAGHPQYVYYTAIVAGIYALLNAAAKARMTRREHEGEHARTSYEGDSASRDLRAFATPLFLFAAMYVTGAMLAAVQLLPGMAVNAESVRAGGLSAAMAGTFSLPPENLLTALAPTFFGTIPTAPNPSPLEGFFGRTYLWETSLFVSVTGFMLALYGAIATERASRRFAGSMVAICLLFALGRYTPLYWVMFKFVPQYSSFRGTLKFASIGVLFIAMLAALGLDRLATSRRSSRSLGIAAVVLAGLLAALGLAVRSSGPSSMWASALSAISDARTGGESNELFVFPRATYRDPAFIASTARHASNAALLGALTILLSGASITFATIRPSVARGTLLGIATIELFVFAHSSIAMTPAKIEAPASWTAAMSRIAKDARVLIVGRNAELYANAGMSVGYDNVWGYDPGVLKRYAELMTYSQGFDPDHARQYVMFREPERNIFRLARCKLILQLDETEPVIPMIDAMPTLTLIRNYSVKRDRDEIFNAISASAFDPRSAVVLEERPAIEPVKGNSIGEATVVAQTNDALEIRATLDTPAILLVTNNVASGWRVRPLDPHPPQPSYDIRPADWAFQAIALDAGLHHFSLEYRPLSFTIGRWVTCATVIAFAVSGWIILRRGATNNASITPKALMPPTRTFR